MEEDDSEYLTRIPDELKIAIFSYLSSFELMRICEFPAFTHLSFDKNLIRKICFYKEYRCRLPLFSGFVLNKLRKDIITSLNVNCVYWIPAAEFKKCVLQLHKLQTFYAVDTKLDFCSKTFNVLSQLNSLALTISDSGLDAPSFFPQSLTNLYLHLDLRKHNSLMDLSHALNKLNNLYELWLIDVSPIHIQVTCMRILLFLPANIKKITIMVQRPSDLALVNALNFSGNLLFKSCKKHNVQICFEEFTESEKLAIVCNGNYKNPAWNTLITRLNYMPFSNFDTRKILLGQYLPENLPFEELNIAHPEIFCSQLFQTTAKTILNSDNMRMLKKLSINFCLCEQESDGVEEKEEPLFKKVRVGIKNNLPIKSTLETVIENSLFIEELELWECMTANSVKLTNGALDAIRNMKNLKKLTLHVVPNCLDGQFLFSICKECQKLMSLRIKGGSAAFHNNLCQALPSATALTEFRYENTYVSIDKLMETLSECVNVKLSRLVIKCNTVVAFSIPPFAKYVSENSQLVLLAMILQRMPKVVIRELSKIANYYKNSPEKVFVIVNDTSNYMGRLPIPYLHMREMFFTTSNVSSIDVFNGFC